MGNCTAQRGSFGTPTAEAAAVSQSNPVNGSVFVARDFRLRQAESIAAQFELIMSFTCMYHLQENDGLLDEGSGYRSWRFRYYFSSVSIGSEDIGHPVNFA